MNKVDPRVHDRQRKQNQSKFTYGCACVIHGCAACSNSLHQIQIILLQCMHACADIRMRACIHACVLVCVHVYVRACMCRARMRACMCCTHRREERRKDLRKRVPLPDFPDAEQHLCARTLVSQYNARATRWTRATRISNARFSYCALVRLPVRMA